MPPILTQVSRASDALPLVATSTPTPNLVVTAKHQQDAKLLMKSMTTGSNRMAIASDKMVFYYLSRDNLCFLTLCEESYPKRQAFLYLDEIADIIMAELLKEHGTNWRITVSQAARPFQFIHYDPIIQKKQRDYRDGSNNNSNSNNNKKNSHLTDDLNEIHTIMRKNIDEILNRGEKLDHVSTMSQELRSKSKDFKWGTKKLTLQARLQQYGPVAIGIVIVLTILYVKIFHVGFGGGTSASGRKK